MRDYLDSAAVQLPHVLPKSDFAQAVNYLNNHWQQLNLFTTDGRIPIDNNDVEQLMRQVATGRKNWLFLGSPDAGERAATLLTLISTALRHDLDVWADLKDALDQLLAGSTDYHSLRPDVWKLSPPQSVRTYRTEVRRDTVNRTRLTELSGALPTRKSTTPAERCQAPLMESRPRPQVSRNRTPQPL